MILVGYQLTMSVYKVHFKWQEKDLQLKATSLDLTHPYFVSIKDLVFDKESKLIIDPSEDEVRRLFGSSKHLMIPFQTVSLIEEFDEHQKKESKLMDFKLFGDEAAEKEETES